ncbi:DUF6415 family natural product biosynthesis protein [Streptomyces sp. NPDC004111]|uniref:DUF6415 family natural product biosynthesis protein n=1 Tax=Streptomyces sp. NPDC004111 TaxID=3364690 RepID=UPI0036A0C646
MSDHPPHCAVGPQDSSPACPLDTALMASTVARAHRALRSRPLPRPDDTELLASLLHSHLALFVHETQPLLTATDDSTRERARRRAVHDTACRALEAAPTCGLAAAAARLRELANSVEHLLALGPALWPDSPPSASSSRDLERRLNVKRR